MSAMLNALVSGKQIISKPYMPFGGGGYIQQVQIGRGVRSQIRCTTTTSITGSTNTRPY
jgi:hypothetical protein